MACVTILVFLAALVQLHTPLLDLLSRAVVTILVFLAALVQRHIVCSMPYCHLKSYNPCFSGSSSATTTQCST